MPLRAPVPRQREPVVDQDPIDVVDGQVGRAIGPDPEMACVEVAVAADQTDGLGHRVVEFVLVETHAAHHGIAPAEDRRRLPDHAPAERCDDLRQHLADESPSPHRQLRTVHRLRKPVGLAHPHTPHPLPSHPHTLIRCRHIRTSSSAEPAHLNITDCRLPRLSYLRSVPLERPDRPCHSTPCEPNSAVRQPLARIQATSARCSRKGGAPCKPGTTQVNHARRGFGSQTGRIRCCSEPAGRAASRARVVATQPARPSGGSVGGPAKAWARRNHSAASVAVGRSVRSPPGDGAGSRRGRTPRPIR